MFKKPLSSILSSFNKTAKDLNDFIQRNDEEEAVLRVEIAEKEATADHMAEDTRKAQVVLNNLTKLMGE
ncbi:MAG: hypothetical protein PVI03_02535 [Candidatus Thorarchaeota archaeon]|jgi:hypothetical protein